MDTKMLSGFFLNYFLYSYKKHGSLFQGFKFLYIIANRTFILLFKIKVHYAKICHNLDVIT